MSLSVVLRHQQDGDRQSVREVLIRAFERPVVADLAEALRASRPANAALCFVAEADDGRIVGQVQLSTSWVDAPARLVEVLVLSPLGVLPEKQGQGVGGRLIKQAVQAATGAGAPLLFLEGDPRLYSRFGFETASHYGFVAPSVRIPDEAFQVMLLPPYQAWMKGALAYAEPFWAFDCVGLRQSDS